MNRLSRLAIEILLVFLDKELEERRLLGGKLDVAGGHRDPVLDVRHVQQPVHRRCQGEVARKLRLAHKDKLIEVLPGGDVPLGHLHRHDDHVLQVLVDAPQLLLQVLPLVVANNSVITVFVRACHCLGQLSLCVENLRENCSAADSVSFIKPRQ